MSDRLKTAGAVALSFLFILAAVYYATAANGHPRVKHVLLFIGLAGLSALAAWFTLPPRDTGPTG